MKSLSRLISVVCILAAFGFSSWAGEARAAGYLPIGDVGRQCANFYTTSGQIVLILDTPYMKLDDLRFTEGMAPYGQISSWRVWVGSNFNDLHELRYDENGYYRIWPKGSGHIDQMRSNWVLYFQSVDGGGLIPPTGDQFCLAGPVFRYVSQPPTILLNGADINSVSSSSPFTVGVSLSQNYGSWSASISSATLPGYAGSVSGGGSVGYAVDAPGSHIVTITATVLGMTATKTATLSWTPNYSLALDVLGGVTQLTATANLTASGVPPGYENRYALRVSNGAGESSTLDGSTTWTQALSYSVPGEYTVTGELLYLGSVVASASRSVIVGADARISISPVSAMDPAPVTVEVRTAVGSVPWPFGGTLTIDGLPGGTQIINLSSAQYARLIWVEQVGTFPVHASLSQFGEVWTADETVTVNPSERLSLTLTPSLVQAGESLGANMTAVGLPANAPKPFVKQLRWESGGPAETALPATRVFPNPGVYAVTGELLYGGRVIETVTREATVEDLEIVLEGRGMRPVPVNVRVFGKISRDAWRTSGMVTLSGLPDGPVSWPLDGSSSSWTTWVEPEGVFPVVVAVNSGGSQWEKSFSVESLASERLSASVTPRLGQAPVTATADVQAVNLPAGAPRIFETSVKWTQDGNPEFIFPSTHEFTEPGVYQVTVELRYGGTVIESKTRTVEAEGLELVFGEASGQVPVKAMLYARGSSSGSPWLHPGSVMITGLPSGELVIPLDGSWTSYPLWVEETGSFALTATASSMGREHVASGTVTVTPSSRLELFASPRVGPPPLNVTWNTRALGLPSDAPKPFSLYLRDQRDQNGIWQLADTLAVIYEFGGVFEGAAQLRYGDRVLEEITETVEASRPIVRVEPLYGQVPSPLVVRVVTDATRSPWVGAWSVRLSGGGMAGVVVSGVDGESALSPWITSDAPFDLETRMGVAGGGEVVQHFPIALRPSRRLFPKVNPLVVYTDTPATMNLSGLSLPSDAPGVFSTEVEWFPGGPVSVNIPVSYRFTEEGVFQSVVRLKYDGVVIESVEMPIRVYTAPQWNIALETPAGESGGPAPWPVAVKAISVDGGAIPGITVDWGDSSRFAILSDPRPEGTYVYRSPGVYEIVARARPLPGREVDERRITIEILPPTAPVVTIVPNRESPFPLPSQITFVTEASWPAPPPEFRGIRIAPDRVIEGKWTVFTPGSEPFSSNRRVLIYTGVTPSAVIRYEGKTMYGAEFAAEYPAVFDAGVSPIRVDLRVFAPRYPRAPSWWVVRSQLRFDGIRDRIASREWTLNGTPVEGADNRGVVKLYLERPGTYVVEHIVRTQTYDVLATGRTEIVVPENQPPVIQDLAVSIDGPIARIAYNTNDSDGRVVRQEVDWGDGIIQPARSNLGHFYRNPGTYAITLRIEDDSGGVAFASQEAIIR